MFLCVRRANFLQLVLQTLAFGMGMFIEVLRKCRGFVNQPVAPALELVELVLCRCGRAVELIEQGADGFAVDTAHQLADELQLAPLCLMRSKALIVGDGLADCIGQVNVCELARIQSGKSETEFLQLVCLTFTLRFTDLEIRHVPD